MVTIKRNQVLKRGKQKKILAQKRGIRESPAGAEEENRVEEHFKSFGLTFRIAVAVQLHLVR